MVVPALFVTGETLPADDHTIRIRLFSELKPERLIFTPADGDYLIEVDGEEKGFVRTAEPLLVFRYGDRLAVKGGTLSGILSDSISIIPDGGTRFSLEIPGVEDSRRYYDDRLMVNLDGNLFFIVNKTSVERYLPGVVEAEGGNGIEDEFFRVQAVIARTYAYRNLDRHISDNYNLCDGVHCQAYYGKTGMAVIKSAVEATRGLVLTDSDTILVNALFHSNCGGETLSSGQVWLAQGSHLVSVRDPYCREMSNSIWRTTIPLQEWITYIYQFRESGRGSEGDIFRFEQPDRQEMLAISGYRPIPLREIRERFMLRSAFFSFVKEGDTLLVSGRGFGHGVGLCQQGAMVMAARGYNYRQIASFYYNGVMVVHIDDARYPETF